MAEQTVEKILYLPVRGLEEGAKSIFPDVTVQRWLVLILGSVRTLSGEIQVTVFLSFFVLVSIPFFQEMTGSQLFR